MEKKLKSLCVQNKSSKPIYNFWNSLKTIYYLVSSYYLVLLSYQFMIKGLFYWLRNKQVIKMRKRVFLYYVSSNAFEVFFI